MAQRLIKHLHHSRIDSLSDGIFSIALTLLGFDLIGVVKQVSEESDLNAALLEKWPVFFAFFLGFLVLYAIWYEYHVTSQYVTQTNVLVIWQHGMILMLVTLIPFATSLLGENINTPNMPWAVFYFGIIIFVEKPISIVFLYFLRKRGAFALTEDAPVDAEGWARLGLTFYSILSIYGLVAILISLINPWVSLALYGLYMLSRVNPVRSFNSAMPRISKRAGVDLEK
jgi:uncharacterized membrane protein